MWFFCSLLFLIIALWVFIQTPFGQNWIISKVTHRLSKDLDTKVEIRHVNFSLFNKMHLEGVLVEDRQKDTLLYAGSVNVRITDWFFFKKNIELKYIGLENAVINMQRSDSVWHHQFLLDYFSSPSSGTKKEGGVQLSLKEVYLKNIVFHKKDAWRGEDMLAWLGSLEMDAKDISLSKKQIAINSLTITDPFFSIYNYPKKKPAGIKTIDYSPKAVDSLLKWNAAGWVMQMDKLEITNGTFKTDKQSSTPIIESFDGRHIAFSNINATFDNLHWEKDTITTKLGLSTKERSGFEVKKLLADIKMTPQEMAFANLDIQTNNSTIRNYYRMNYDEFDDMGDYIHKVRMQGNFDNSEIDSDDIAYFAPALKTWKKKIILKGNIRGTVDDLIGKDLVVEAGRNTLLNGDISMTGLPDINQTFIDFKANDFRTTYEDAVAIVPAVSQVNNPDLRKLQFIRFNGSFTGFIRDFVTYGTIQSSLGTVKSDLNMKLPAGQDPVYSGTISSDLFRLGEFIGDPNIGTISMSGSLKGKGFSEKTRNAEVDGKIRYVDFNGYRYSNITVKGKLDKKLFDGMASINDPEAELTLNGLIDFNSKVPVFNFIADAKKANLKKLNLTKDDIGFSGKFKLDFTGDNIDNFLGKANITEASLTRNGMPLPFDSLIISSEYVNNIKTLKAHSNEFEGTVTGNFTIRDLPDAFKLFLNKYYPSYIKPPKRLPGNESFTFDITTQYIDDYVKLIDSTLSGFNNSNIKGSLNTATNELTLNADIPQFKIGSYNFDNVKLNANGNSDSLSLYGGASNINISDSLNIPLALFRINAHDDTSQVRIFTGANQAINQARLDAQVLTYDNGVKIEFNPSSFAVNGKTWTIDENGELEFRTNTPASGQLVLRESNQEVRVRTKWSEFGNHWNDIEVELKKVNLGDFAPFFAPKNRLEGLISGNVLIENPTGNLVISSDEVLAEGFRLDNDSIGDAKITQVLYDNLTKKLTAKVNTLNQENNLTADVDISFDKEKQKDNRIALKAKNFQLKILERFLGGLFTDIQGFVTGEFDILGEFDKLQVVGKGRLKDAGLKVVFTQCFYKIQDRDIEMKPTEINMDGIILTDPVTGNPIYLTGGIQHNAFKDMFYDLTVSTRKPGTTGANNNRPILLLNTTYKDNKQFYGRVKGTGSFSLSGPQSEMYMKIDAIASATDTSTVTIPSSESRESGIADFLVERKYGREMVDTSFKTGGSNITYDVDVTANPKVLVKVVLDELTGDEIKGRGTGSLNIHSGTNEKLTMRGKFDIQEGDYLFTFQSFFKKPFVLTKGVDNYISWTGDPYTAQIKFKATYTAENVSFAPLANANYIEQSLARQREDVYVVVDLSGELFKPEFKFSLDFPPNSPTKSDFALASSIQQMEKNLNEINRQVTYLIVFNSFAPPENSQSNGLSSALGEFTNSTISSISGIFFNEINKKLNSELSKILKSDNISINFSGSVYNRNLLSNQTNSGLGFNQGNFNVNVPISLFKDRFIVTLGSTLDVPLQSSIQQYVQFLPDVTAEWLINQTGTVRASFFYRQNIDYLTSNTSGAGRNKRYGSSIAYRKEFDTLDELFGGKKKKKSVAVPPAQPASDTLQTSSSPVSGGSN
ncbi:MAG: translocation/assembly module TamB domain-containing protein [Chitinophagaceae bacterium]|nr:translocation/assembly module TamB domain-containing protein [Chitinophagaceae bacterium]